MGEHSTKLSNISDLKPWERNPRKILDRASKGLGASVTRFGDLSGIVYNKRTDRLVCGHQRVKVLTEAGAWLEHTDRGLEVWLEREDRQCYRFPVRLVDWSESDERDANIAANNRHIAGEFTDDLQALLEESLAERGPDYMSELCLDDLLKEHTKAKPEPDATDDGHSGELAGGQTVTKTGDLWRLGQHRLLCGDSLSDMGYALLGERPDLIFTDPPYNVGGKMDSGFYANTDSPGMVELSEAGWDIDFDIRAWLAELGRHLPNNGSVYVCTSHLLAGDIWQAMSEFGAKHNSYCVWCKSNPLPSLAKRHWAWGAELITYATFGKHTFNYPSEGNALSWWNIPTQQANRLHPTQKPVEVPSRAITHSSNKGHLVFDAFLGSGTTLIACEQLDRRCIGVEMSPKYCDTIIERWEALTGDKAQRD